MRRLTLPALVGAVVLTAVTLSGCVRRSLTIQTDPPGGLVYINDQLKGPAPLSYDFMWYGWHRVMIRKEGFERVDDRRLIRAPLYLWVPLDLVMELLPLPIRDERTWSYSLTPAPLPPTPVAPNVAPATPVAPAPPVTEPDAPASPAPDAPPQPTQEPAP